MAELITELKTELKNPTKKQKMMITEAKAILRGQPELRWYYGLPATGKSTSILKEFKKEDVYFYDGPKWEEYTQQRVCVIDDFVPWQLQLKTLLAIMKGEPLKVGMPRIPFNSQIIIIIAYAEPAKVYDDQLKKMNKAIKKSKAISGGGFKKKVL